MSQDIEVLVKISGKSYEGTLHLQSGEKRTEIPKANPPVFPEPYAQMLLVKDEGDVWSVRPREFLRPEDFAEILNIVKGYKGQYISAGKFSHFSIPK